MKAKLYFPYKYPNNGTDNGLKNVTEYLSFIALYRYISLNKCRIEL